MFKVKVYGEINGKDIVLVPCNCYEVKYINFEGTFKFKGVFFCLDRGKLIFRNVDDMLFESVDCGYIMDIKEIK